MLFSFNGDGWTCSLATRQLNSDAISEICLLLSCSALSLHNLSDTFVSSSQLHFKRVETLPSDQPESWSEER